MTAILKLKVDGLHCASCVRRLETALLDLPQVDVASVNLGTETAVVKLLGESANLPESLAGFSLSENAPKAERPTHSMRLVWIAAFLTLPVVVLAMGGHVWPAFFAGIDTATNHWVQFALTTLVLFWPGAQFYQIGLPALLRGHPEMNSLVAIGTLAAWGYSCVVVLAPSLLPEQSRDVYFEAAAVIVTLILLGRALEARAKGRVGDAVASLLRLQPSTAQVAIGDGFEAREIELIKPGDRIQAKPGEAIAVDGRVEIGESYVDESMLTGEPIPVAKGQDDLLHAGTLNANGLLVYVAEAVGSDTTLSRIAVRVEEAQDTRLPIQSLINKITAWFVPAVLGLAALTLCVWLAFGPGVSAALVAGVSVLIIACPCALGLATPMSVLVGTGRAAELGVLFGTGDALQRLHEVDVIAFDKTGTLTEGTPVLQSVEPVLGTEAEALFLAASAEQGSDHPVAKALVAGALERGIELVTPQSFENASGLGIRARVDGSEVLLGSAKFLSQHGVDVVAQPYTHHLAVDGQLAARFVLSDQVKPETAETLGKLRAAGYRLALISGDKASVAESIGAELGVERAIGDVLPEGKAEALEAIRAPGETIAFVGDGINDAPALATADVGIALGTGTHVAIEAADVVLMRNDLGTVVDAIEMSRASMGNIRQNLGWAFGYNLLLIPVAAGVLFPFTGMLLSPMLAAAAMALSSVFVVSNALRLRRAR